MTRAVNLAQAASGTIMQVVFNSATTTLTSTTTSVSDMLTATITPTSAASRIFIICSVHVSATASSNAGAAFYIFRGSSTTGTQIYTNYAGNSGATGSWIGMTPTTVDSPSTTSPVTYTLSYGKASGGTTSITTEGNVYSITLMEIAG